MKRESLDYPEIPFHALLQRTAAAMPNKRAIVFGDRTLTFAEWDRQANQMAYALLDLGLQAGDRIALYTPNCPEYEIVFMGAARIGAVPTPLNPSYKEREVRHQLADSGASVLFVGPALYPLVAAVQDAVPDLRQVIVIGDDAPAGTQSFGQLIAGQPGTDPEVALRMNDLAALPYSSGTTGLSKGVMLTQRNLVRNALQFVQATESTEKDSLLIFLPLYHIYGVSLMAVSAACGARQVLMERFDLQEVVRLIGEEGITELYVVPPVMLALANTPDLHPGQFRGLRFIMSAAAPLAPEVARRVSERLEVPVIQAYGLTESSPLTHMVLISRATEVMGSVGEVAADTECRIVDIETGERELPPAEVGEVVVSGPQVMAGYWKAPDDTAYALRNGWLYTGDIGRVDEEGNLYIVDRKKEMIKYRAWSIAPAELEATLLEHPAVNDCAVVGAPHREAGEAPHAFVVLGQGQTATPEELQRFVAERVATYKQIQTLEIVEAIPRTPSGKILRRVLKAQVRGAATGAST